MNKTIFSTLLLSLTLLLSQSSFAQLNPISLGQACAKISGTIAATTFQTECNLLNEGHPHLDELAISACSRLTDAGYGNLIIFPCLVAIRGKSYTAQESNYCDSLTDENQTIACFHEYGKFVGAAAPTAGRELNVSVGAILGMLRTSSGALSQYQTDTAQEALSKAISTLSAAQQISCQ